MTQSDYPALELPIIDIWQDEQVYIDAEYGWRPKDIWAAADVLPTYDIPIMALLTDQNPWDDVGTDFMTFLAHAKLVNDADLSYPIILTPSGYIADGRHRLGKAIINGHTTIKAKRLTKMPEPFLEFDEEGNATELF